MLPILVLVFLVALIIIGVAKGIDDRGTGYFVAGVVCLPILAACWIGVYSSSVDANGKLRVAQQNLTVLRTTTQRINDIAMITNTADGVMVQGVENLSQSSKASEALMTYSNKIVEYNEMIGQRQALRSNWLLCCFVAPLPRGVDVFELNLTKKE